MITPDLKDLGRPVIYYPDGGREKRGILSSFNGNFVYVQFGEGPASKACRREDLFWVDVT